MADFILYGFWVSPFVISVGLFMRKCNIEFEYCKCSPYNGATLAAEHGTKNPLRKIPTLYQKSTKLYVSETMVIFRFLKTLFPEKTKNCTVPLVTNEDGTNNMADHLKFEQCVEAINNVMQGSLFNWIVYGCYFIDPKVFNWKELAYELGCSRVSNESMMAAMFGRIAGAFTTSDNTSSLLLDKDDFTFADIVLYATLDAIDFFSKVILENVKENPFKPQQMYPFLVKFQDKMKQQDEVKWLIKQQEEEEEETIKELYTTFKKAYDNEDNMLEKLKQMFIASLPAATPYKKE